MNDKLPDIIRADGTTERLALAELKVRADTVQTGVDETVSAILDDVKKRGLSAVSEYAKKFDGEVPRELTREEISAAREACYPRLVSSLENAASRIRAYQEKLLSRSIEWEDGLGAKLGSLVRGLSRVGIYVPGGTAAYPSSVLMNAIPAKVAGVSEIIMITPPGEHLTGAVLAAADIAGVDRVIAVGGAHGIAALTYGADFIPKVDKIVGPGNAYVAAAKRLAYGTVDIDMIAGPSEILIIADAHADPAFVAADLLSQAEHDRLSSAILLSDSLPLLQAVRKELDAQLDVLGRGEIAAESLQNYGALICCRSLSECVDLANFVAPEHLEIMVLRPRDLLHHIKNAGAVFLGSYSPEPIGDYLAGPSHVLPTSGTARFFSPLSVDSFLKKTSVIELSQKAFMALSHDTEDLALTEGLTAHANSVALRIRKLSKGGV
ncbi:histidinol dehydrogenase [Oscillospiraceae bacterium OttesenSCG-928-G22]|nr:histidinol dehydrogenase [Oscillospiraceae bacterium OttesenSCG-928-G22]